MASEKISALASLGTAPAIADLLVIVDVSDLTMATTGTTKNMTIGDLESYISAWKLNGNTVGSEKWIGTADNFALPFRTNNVEVGRFSTAGNFGIGVDPTTSLHIAVPIARATTKLTSNSGAGVAGFIGHTIDAPLGASLGIGTFNDGDAVLGQTAFVYNTTNQDVSLIPDLDKASGGLGAVRFSSGGYSGANQRGIIDENGRVAFGISFTNRRPTTALVNGFTINGTSQFNDKVGIGIGYIAPTASLHIQGSGSTSATYGLKVQNSSSAISLQVRDDGVLLNYGGGSQVANTVFGLGMIANTTGDGNASFGYNALLNNTTGNFSVAIGYETLKVQTTGQWNVAIGYSALKGNNGDANVAIGYQSLFTNTTGYYNHAIGRDALLYNTTGVENTAIGYRCLYQNISGNDNIAIGYSALLSNTTGNENIAIGYRALETSTGTGSVALGLDAGRAVGSSAGGVFLGYGAGRFETGASKLFIDNNSRASEADGRVKALIYGEFAANSEDQRITFNSFLRVKPHTVTEIAAGVTPANGDIVYASDTDATFTSVGFWGYVAGAWGKLNN
jgi:hypothetical protein